MKRSQSPITNHQSAIILIFLLCVVKSLAQPPRFGQVPDEQVIAAMTVEEKVNLLVGTCKDWNLVPEPAPATIHRPPVPEGYWDTYQGNTAAMKGKVPGAAGVSYAIPRLGVPSVVLADGPVGLRIDSVCTAFPSTALLAATRDTGLVYRVGQAIGEEMRYYGVDILLAPGINMMRNPLCGRNYEYMSSDPHIAAMTAAAYVRGVQSQGVGACLKHFAVNNQETYRNGIDVQLSDTLLRARYLRAFELVVKEAHPWTVMSSYNKINGVYASENTYLLTDILRGEWCFDGFVMTDWWAEEDPVRMQIAGNDMLMPGTQLQIDTLIAAVHDGRLSETVLDRNLMNVLRIIRRTPSFRCPDETRKGDKQSMLARHAALAREAAAKGMVLLKNNRTLPISNHQSKIALLGIGSYDTYVGGTGSGCVTRAYSVSIAEGLSRAGFAIDSALAETYNRHIALSRAAQPQESAWFMPYISELLYGDDYLSQLARTNNMAILTIRRMAGEGGDRRLAEGDYYLTKEEKQLVSQTSRAFHREGKKVILILNIGTDIELTDVCDQVDAILLAWLPGQEAGNAVADVFTGVVPPAGKLPMPFYRRYEDVPSAPDFPSSDGDPNKVCYREGFAEPARTLFPVGYGLTYPYPQSAQWLRTAEAATPSLRHTRCTPVRMVEPVQDSAAFQGWRYTESSVTPAQMDTTALHPSMVFTYDFGRHMVGYLSFSTRTLRRCQDAPVRLRLFMGELPAELNTPLEPWGAWLSRAWMQDEIVNIYETDRPITLPRRLAGRYLRVEVLGASLDFDCALTDISFDAVTSAGDDTGFRTTSSPMLDSIRAVSIATLSECMQTVYEDGPKRDRRLWSGDLYLQSLANRYSFRNFGLTKRCLYLFAALTADDGRLISNLFEHPSPHPQEGSYMITYSLLWNSTLLEYLIDTGDTLTAQELWPVARRQMEDALSYVGTDGLFDIHKRDVWIFFDWREHEGLDVSAAMQAATIFALDQTYELARRIGRTGEVKSYPALAAKMRRAAMKHLYDPQRGVILSGPERQLSVQSQTWAVKAGILSGAKARKALTTAMNAPEAIQPGTPYATHYLVEAMIIAGMGAQARAYLIDYWGGMVRKGADTFWEAYDPDDDFISPYDFTPVNSACHAWSCTPVYFIGKYPGIFK